MVQSNRIMVVIISSSSSCSLITMRRYLAGVVADAAQLKGDVRLLFDARS
jgi:hypothetical protein